MNTSIEIEGESPAASSQVNRSVFDGQNCAEASLNSSNFDETDGENALSNPQSQNNGDAKNTTADTTKNAVLPEESVDSHQPNEEQHRQFVPPDQTLNSAGPSRQSDAETSSHGLADSDVGSEDPIIKAETLPLLNLDTAELDEFLYQSEEEVIELDDDMVMIVNLKTGCGKPFGMNSDALIKYDNDIVSGKLSCSNQVRKDRRFYILRIIS